MTIQLLLKNEAKNREEKGGMEKEGITTTNIGIMIQN